MRLSGPVRPTLEEFESGVFTLKCYEMLSVYTTTEVFENTKISVSL